MFCFFFLLPFCLFSFLILFCFASFVLLYLILYPAVFLKVWESSLVELLGLLPYYLRIVILSLLPFQFLFLVPFSCVIDLAKTSSSILYRYGDNELHCLVPDFSEIALSTSTLI